MSETSNNKYLSMLLVLFVLLCSSRGEAWDLKSRVHEFRLSNGMRWFVVKRKQAPVFSGVVMVHVGGADESPGKTGLAHMFEHMAFKGSSELGTKDFSKERPILEKIEEVGDRLTLLRQNPATKKSDIKKISDEFRKLEREADAYRVKNEIWQVMMRNGGADLNAYTSKDVTAYHASMPSNRLKLWARVMSEMTFDPVYREFYTERDVIAEERRSSVENNPEGMMSEKLLNASYRSGPYSWSTIGFEKDIEGLTISDARSFHDRFYKPSNMIGVLVGDLNLRETKKIIKEVFGKYSSVPGEGEDTVKIEDKGGLVTKFAFNAEPSLAIAYHKPTLPNPDEYVFDVIESLLCEGRSSRMEKLLVYDKRLAESIYCTVSYPGSRFENLFLIWIEPMKPHLPEEVLRAVNAELEKLIEEPVSKDELARVIKRVKASLVFSLDSNMKLAQMLAQFQTIFGDWRLLADYPDRISKVTESDVQSVAKKYFKVGNRIVVERMKAKK